MKIEKPNPVNIYEKRKETAADIARSGFMKPGEVFLTNIEIEGWKPRTAIILGKLNEEHVSVKKYIELHKQTGRYESIRSVEDAAFDIKGNPVKSCTAIFAVPKKD